MQYNRTGIVSTGPVFSSVHASSPALGAVHATATVSYVVGTAVGLHQAGTADCSLVGTKLCCGESPFQVLLRNGTWQRTNYSLTAAETVVLSLPAEAARPVGARYAWEPWPLCSLYNGEGGPDDHSGIAATPFCWNQTKPCPY